MEDSITAARAEFYSDPRNASQAVTECPGARDREIQKWDDGWWCHLVKNGREPSLGTVNPIIGKLQWQANKKKKNGFQALRLCYDISPLLLQYVPLYM